MKFLFPLCFFMLLGAGLGAVAGHPAWGVAAGALLWRVVDARRQSRFLRWLCTLQETLTADEERAGVSAGTKNPPQAENPPCAAPHPPLGGVWKLLGEQVERLLRLQQKRVQHGAARLDEVRTALEASPDGVIFLDREAHIEWCNRAARAHFGLDVRDLGQAVTHLLRDPVFIAYLAAGRFESPVEWSPSSALRLSVQIHPYGDGQRLLRSRDITALGRLEATRREFVANVSHEIRTPLTVLSGFIETLRELPLSEAERMRYLGLMARQAERMQNLVADLLTLSRLEDSQPPGFSEWTPVAVLFADCAQDARALADHLAQEKGGAPQHLRFAPERPAGEIAGAAGELRSALFNLIANAVRYSPPGGEIEVRWTPEADGGATFAVEDSGPGIAPEHLARLTERFYRVDPSRSRETGGTGLGLAIVKHALQRHDAVLEIQSEPGRGACFSARFPAKRLKPGFR